MCELCVLVIMELEGNFLCGLRGYHEYRLVWSPTIHEVLRAKQEPNNRHDRYAIACVTTTDRTETVVGHLQKEVSRFAFYIINYGARISAKVVSTQYRRSPLVQGGLEIPIRVTVRMSCCGNNKVYLQKFLLLIKERYQEPVDGKFDDATSSILKKLYVEDEKKRR